MDPLSITASAIAVIELTTEIVKGLRKFYKSANNAPREVAELIDELNTFGAILQRLKILSQHAKAAQSQQRTAAAGSSQRNDNLPMLPKVVERDAPLNRCYEEMLAFNSKLISNQSRLKKALKWPFQKEEVQAMFSRLRNLKSLLDTAIMSDQL